MDEMQSKKQNWVLIVYYYIEEQVVILGIVVFSFSCAILFRYRMQ